MELLPEGCIADILSRTTRADACRLSVVSKLFNSAAKSDAVWCRFLPSDVVSRSDAQSSLLASSPSKKALYLALSDHPIIIDEGKKSFQLDKKSGKKCCMLAATPAIVWGDAPADTPQSWKWTTLPGSRFPEVAELTAACWLQIRAVMNTLALSPNTQYAAYFVFKIIEGHGISKFPVWLSVGIVGGETSTKNVCLDPNLEGGQESSVAGLQLPNIAGLQRPNMRSDGWLEIEMGEFFNSGLEDEEVHLDVEETESGWGRGGLIVEGIEVRPKN